MKYISLVISLAFLLIGLTIVIRPETFQVRSDYSSFVGYLMIFYGIVRGIMVYQKFSKEKNNEQA